MKTTNNVPLKALCLTLGVHFTSSIAQRYGVFDKYQSLSEKNGANTMEL